MTPQATRSSSTTGTRLTPTTAFAALMQVEHVDFVSVPTRDLPRALAFYRDVLGLPESEYSEGELETPNVTLSFWNPDERRRAVPAQQQPGSRCGSPTSRRPSRSSERPAARSIAVQDSGVCHMGFVKDLDGNVADPAPALRAEEKREQD